jgi:hypothetical protein
VPKGNARLSEIVGGHFDVHLIANADADKILSHFARDVGEDFVAVLQSHPKHRAGQNLSDRAGDFYWLFFGHALNLFMLRANLLPRKPSVGNISFLAGSAKSHWKTESERLEFRQRK